MNPIAMVRAVKDGENEYDHLAFVCPGCEGRNDGASGLHLLAIAGSARKGAINRPAWDFNGSLEKPTLSPSIKTEDGAGFVCHSFLRDGVFDFLGDCTHKFANQKVAALPLPDWFLGETP